MRPSSGRRDAEVREGAGRHGVDEGALLASRRARRLLISSPRRSAAGRPARFRMPPVRRGPGTRSRPPRPERHPASPRGTGPRARRGAPAPARTARSWQPSARDPQHHPRYSVGVCNFLIPQALLVLYGTLLPRSVPHRHRGAMVLRGSAPGSARRYRSDRARLTLRLDRGGLTRQRNGAASATRSQVATSISSSRQQQYL